jgi:CHAT domain-containing protein
MIRRHRPIAAAAPFAVLAFACLALAGCAGVKAPAPSAAGAGPRRDVLMTRTPGAVQPGWAEPLQRLAYQDNTTNWSYGAAIDIDRDLARSSDKNSAPLDARIRARIALAYSLSSIGEVGEAKAELEDADSELKTNADALSRLDRRLLPVDLLTGRSIVAGAEGAQAEAMALAARSPRLVANYTAQATAAYAAAADLAHQAAELASQPLAEEGGLVAGAAAQVGEDIRLDPEKTNLYNSRNRSGSFGDIVARPMTGGEKLKVLQIRARYAESTALLAGGRVADAAAVNDHARAQMASLTVGVADWLRAELEAQQAEISRRQGDPAKGEAVLKQSLAIVRLDQGQTGLEAFLDRELAQAAAAKGDMALAKESEAASFKILIDRYDELHPSRKELGAYLDLLAPGAASGDAAEVERFFEVASIAVETETARAVQDVAARFSAGDNATGQAMRAMQAASADVRSAQARLARIRSAEKVSPQVEKSAEAEELAARQALAQRTEAFVKAAGAKAGAVLSPLTTVAKVQAVLHPHEAYLRYIFLDDGRGYAILVLKDRAKVVDLKLTAREAETQLAFLRGSAEVADPDHRSFDLAGAHDFYERLFAGLGPDLEGADSLVIEPAGPLFSLPFGALVTAAPTPDMLANAAKDEYAGVPWLAQGKALELSVSAAGFVRLRDAPGSKAPKPILAFADPLPLAAGTAKARADQIATDRIAADTAGALSAPSAEATQACARETEAQLTFPRLTDTRDEAQAAIADLGGNGADLVAGDAFTDSAVRERKDLDQYKLILFATHAALPRRASCWRNPFLFTTLGAAPLSDGVLETTEIAQLALDADLVVLSACNTGAAGASGQALGGLAQSFIFAGARGVIVSHWEADSKGAAMLMRRMYGALAKGDTPSLALTQAQRAMMETPGYAHPYYWALFTTVGGAPMR